MTVQEQEYSKSGSMPLERAMSLALSAKELLALSKAQKRLFLNMLALAVDKRGDKVTPDEIQGIYEIVTEHLLPPDLET